MKTQAKIILSILVLIIIIGALYYFGKDPVAPLITPPNNNQAQTTPETTPITITESDITEANYTGTRPIITGSSIIAVEANTFIKQTIARFSAQADRDVPDMRKQFGVDAPPANYSIDINAKYLKGPTTESIVVDWYEYTGGANGNSLYKVFTTTLGGTKLMSLSGAIKGDKQDAFLALLKQKLIAWRPDGTTTMAVFAEDVNNLKFSDIQNWSLDGTSLTIYFSKYAIGPGVLGPVAFPLPLSIAKDYLIPDLTAAPKVSAGSDTNTGTGITYTKATKDLITVQSPTPGAVTGKNFSVIGKARGGWFFEASFPVELRDKNGKLLATAIAKAQGDWMTSNFVPFKADINVPATYIGAATLVLQKDNASGLPENDASISFPITVEY